MPVGTNTYALCVQTFSLRGATNEVKVCAEITIAYLGSPSLSPSGSVSPSFSSSPSESPSASVSPSEGGAPSALETYWAVSVEQEAAASERWNSSNPSSIQTGIADAHGRVYFTSGVRGRQVLGANYGSLTARMRFRPTLGPTGTGRQNLIVLGDTTATPQVELNTLDDGSIEVEGDGFLHASATGLWIANAWFYIELMAVIADAGSYSVKLWDDALNLLATITGNDDTQRTANAFSNVVHFGNTNIDTYIDDISIDLGGALLDAPSMVVKRDPAGNGDLTQWTRGGTDTGNNYDQVDEAIKDTTSYVDSTDADQYDFYTVDLSSLGGTMKALQVNALARAVSAGTQQFKLALRIGGVTYDGIKTHSVTSTSADLNCWEVWDNNPATGNEWAGTETVQIGLKSVTSNVRVHKVCAEVLVSL